MNILPVLEGRIFVQSINSQQITKNASGIKPGPKVVGLQENVFKKKKNVAK